MDIKIVILIMLSGYLIGAISFARVMAYFVGNDINLDKSRTLISETGEKGVLSGIGASTVSLALGPKYGGIVSFLDMLKAFIPVLLLRILFPESPYDLIFSLFAIIGHNWPVYYRFQGGRGVSVLTGSLMAIDPIGTIVALIIGILIALLINNPPISFLLWFPFLALWSWVVREDIHLIVYSIILPILYILAALPDFKLAIAYQRQGRNEEYNQMMLDSFPQMRGLKRMAQFLRFWERNT